RPPRAPPAGLFTAWVGEAPPEERLQPLYQAWAAQAIPIEATILASGGQLELQLSARGEADAAGAGLGKGVGAVADTLGPHVISTDGRSIEQVVGDALLARGWR